jgi:hypothetical protein
MHYLLLTSRHNGTLYRSWLPSFHVIHCLQNTFVPIVYDTHILHILHHHFLQPLKEPVPTITVLPSANAMAKGSN